MRAGPLFPTERNEIRCVPVGAVAPQITMVQSLGEETMMRLTNALAGGIAAVGLVLGSGVLLGGCKSSGGSSTAEEKPAPAKAAPTKAEKPVEGKPAPAGSKLSKVMNDMSPEPVQEIMGSPSGQAQYPTGKSFNPYNFGNDSGHRVEYKYKGQGRVIFAVPKWGGNMKVVRVDYDPTEDGN